MTVAVTDASTGEPLATSVSAPSPMSSTELERYGRTDLDGNAVDKDPVAGSDSVLMTAVLKDCVHLPLSPGAGSLH